MAAPSANVLRAYIPLALRFNVKWSFKKEGLRLRAVVTRSKFEVLTIPCWFV